MSKSDLQARPIYHHKRDFHRGPPDHRVRRTIQIQVGPRTITAADPLPDDLQQVLEAITRPS